VIINQYAPQLLVRIIKIKSPGIKSVASIMIN
jgi:hypothetical protein